MVIVLILVSHQIVAADFIFLRIFRSGDFFIKFHQLVFRPVQFVLH